MRFVPVNAVKEGTALAKNLYDTENRILLRKGIILTNKLKKRILNNKIYSIYINDEYSQNEIEDIIKPELRLKAVNTLKDAFVFMKNNNQILDTPVSSSKKSKVIKKQEEYLSRLHDIAESIIQDITAKRNILVNLVDIKSFDNYTYQHSINVCILSLVLGIDLDLNSKELYNLCVGAMLHDMGKIFTPKEILSKNGKLDNVEFTIIKKHTEQGYEYLRNCFDVSSTSRIISLQHHERVDGNGYPNGLIDDDIYKLSKIVAVADVYDALTSDRPYRKAMSPNEAVEYIMANGGKQFDFKIVELFCKKVIPYPVGSIVRLSNDESAVVEEIRNDFPLRPKVKLIKDNSVVDLLDQLDIVIHGIQYEVN